MRAGTRVGCRAGHGLHRVESGSLCPRELIPSRTLGVDLASQPKETGVCLIDWSSGSGEVVDLEEHATRRGFNDDRLIALMQQPAVAKVGIDAPFGWPLSFIDAITTYRDTGAWLDLEEKREIRYRLTETSVATEFRQEPLSVATSDLAWPAMRCARLLSRLAGEGERFDRSGRGPVAEVYPMAALRRWGVISAGTPSAEWAYKGTDPSRIKRREQHLETLKKALRGAVQVSDSYFERCVRDDDDFDAFVCALVARALALGLTDPVPRGQAWLALREGWIHLPAPGSAAQLATT